MDPLSGPGGMNPAEMQAKRQSMFQKSDGNGDGSLTLEEMLSSHEEEGLSTDRAERMFNKMDADGDGIVTQAESDQAFEKMREKMASMMSSIQGESSEVSENDPVSALLEILNRNDEGTEQMKSRLQAEHNIGSTGYNQTGTLPSGSYRSLINLTA